MCVRGVLVEVKEKRGVSEVKKSEKKRNRERCHFLYFLKKYYF